MIFFGPRQSQTGATGVVSKLAGRARLQWWQGGLGGQDLGPGEWSGHPQAGKTGVS